MSMSIAPIVAPRRKLLRLALLFSAAAAAGCTVSHTGTLTTATIDIDRLLLDGRAIVATLRGALAVPGVAALLGANLSVAEAALAAATLAMDEIARLAGGGSVTLAVDTAHLQALVLSLLGDAQSVLALLQMASGGGTTAAPGELSTLVAAAASLVPLVQRAAGLATVPAGATPMSEAEALRLAGRS